MCGEFSLKVLWGDYTGGHGAAEGLRAYLSNIRIEQEVGDFSVRPFLTVSPRAVLIGFNFEEGIMIGC